MPKLMAIKVSTLFPRSIVTYWWASQDNNIQFIDKLCTTHRRQCGTFWHPKLYQEYRWPVFNILLGNILSMVLCKRDVTPLLMHKCINQRKYTAKYIKSFTVLHFSAFQNYLAASSNAERFSEMFCGLYDLFQPYNMILLSVQFFY